MLYTSLTEYWMSCVRKDVELNNNEYVIFRKEPKKEAPFKIESETNIQVLNENDYSNKQLQEYIDDFKPDAVYVAGWINKFYLKIARKYKKMGKPVICGMDNQWRNTLKQQIGVIVSRIKIKSYFTHIWVPGMLQYNFATRLGFKKKEIMLNLYSCDTDAFNVKQTQIEKRFLFVGRLVAQKGIETLINAYNNIKLKDWPLHIIGSGPCQNMIVENERDMIIHDNVVYNEFVQPEDVCLMMKKGGVFVLPASYEAWGLVIHEAATAGMPIITTHECGAAYHLVKNGYNGYLIEPDNEKQLQEAMAKIANKTDEEIKEMGNRSKELARSFTPEIWSKTLSQVI